MPYCKVRECRFADTHTTKAHVCGVCKNSGHGEIECFYPGRKTYLAQFHAEQLPLDMHCTISDCTTKEYHTIEAHHCDACKLRVKHSYAECPNAQQQYHQQQQISTNIMYNVQCPLCRADNTLSNPKKILGLSDQCCICMSNNVEILMPTCYHCCVCLDCLKRM